MLYGAVACTAVVSVVLAGLAWKFAGDRADTDRAAAEYSAQAADRAAALRAGSDFLIAAYTVDAAGDKGMSKWHAAMSAATTDTLRDRVQQTKAVLSLLTEADASMTGAVEEVAVVSQNDKLIRLLAVLRLTGRAPGQTEPTSGSVTEYIDLIQVNGTWKVFGYQDIAGKSAAGVPDSGLPGLPATQPQPSPAPGR
ncbi:hypothetical protein HLB23_14065 [Nocardia uniformis]|uniref:Mce-associated membrane protein n=1 Tax=Nocardia uniformis TaxID=53432 RepID=A0A849BXH0_9NOCA|nr:hypothetical protein [Nocardia uniformis]NNH70974.1 hypothetical protein [Nocardia uniformis]